MHISSVILSGGRATRMNGVDKGLVILQNQPLIAHVIARLKPQVDEILINANRELAIYEALGYPVLQDESDDFQGPLAGFLLGLKHAKHDLVLIVPCDSPFLPVDLASRLLQVLVAQDVDIAVAKVGMEVHPVFCLCRKGVLASLEAYLAQGGRKVSAWQKSQRYIEVDFGQAEAFANINTPQDIAKYND